MGTTLQYKVAHLSFRISFADGKNDKAMLPSFPPFETEVDDQPVLFTLTVDDSALPPHKGREIGQFDTGASNNGVYITDDGGYQILVSDVCNAKCCLLQANSDFSVGTVALRGNRDMRQFGLNNAIMMMYAFASADKDTLLMHASVIRHAGIGYLFLGVSGTGKSTHTANWLKYIDGTDLMNDDNPVVRVVDGKAVVYGSPWSGKTPCYRNIEAPIGGFVQLKQAPYNKISRMSVIETFASLLPSCSVMKWDRRDYIGVCDTVNRVMQLTKTFFLENLPDEEAVQLSFNTLTSGQKS